MEEGRRLIPTFVQENDEEYATEENRQIIVTDNLLPSPPMEDSVILQQSSPKASTPLTHHKSTTSHVSLNHQKPPLQRLLCHQELGPL